MSTTVPYGTWVITCLTVFRARYDERWDADNRGVSTQEAEELAARCTEAYRAYMQMRGGT